MSPTAFMSKLRSAKVAARLLSALLFIVLVTMVALETFFLTNRFTAPLLQRAFDDCYDTMLQAQRHGMALDQVNSGYTACIDQVGQYHAVLLGTIVGMWMGVIYIAFMIMDRHIAITIGKSGQSPLRIVEFIRSHTVHLLVIIVTPIIGTFVAYQIIS